MLPREVVEEFVGRRCAPGLCVLKTVADPLKGLLIILALPFEVFSQGVIERVGGALSAPARKLFEFRQPLGLDGQRLHVSKVELGDADVNTRAAHTRAAQVDGNFTRPILLVSRWCL